MNRGKHKGRSCGKLGGRPRQGIRSNAERVGGARGRKLWQAASVVGGMEE